MTLKRILSGTLLIVFLITRARSHLSELLADESLDAVMAWRCMAETLAELEHVELRASYEHTLTSDKRIVEGRGDTPYVARWGPDRILLRRTLQRTLLSEVSQRVNRAGKRRIYQYDWIDKDDELLCVHDRLTDEFRQDAPSDNTGVSFSSKRLAGERATEDLNWLLEGRNAAGIFLGYLGYFPLKDYCDESTRLIAVKDGLAGLECASSLGQIELWLDPKAGFLPKRLKLIKHGSHRTNQGREIQSIQMNGDDDQFPSGGVRRMTWIADEIAHREQSGVFYMSEITLRETLETLAGPAVTTTVTGQIDDIRFSPEFSDADFAPLLSIPEGTRVTIVGAEHLPFEWDGRAAVPAVSRPADVAAETPATPVGSRIGFVIAANLVLGGLIACVLLIRRRRHG